MVVFYLGASARSSYTTSVDANALLAALRAPARTRLRVRSGPIPPRDCLLSQLDHTSESSTWNPSFGPEPPVPTPS